MKITYFKWFNHVEQAYWVTFGSIILVCIKCVDRYKSHTDKFVVPMVGVVPNYVQLSNCNFLKLTNTNSWATECLLNSLNI